MNFLNVVVGVSNLACLYPMQLAYYAGDDITVIAAVIAGLASTVYHLFESHKHEMPGFGCSHKHSKRLLWVDRIGVLLSVIRMIILYYARHGAVWYPPALWSVVWFCIAFLVMLYSEKDTLSVSQTSLTSARRLSYVISHSLWHILVFWVMGQTLLYTIYIHV
jgi:hypothetical protein